MGGDGKGLGPQKACTVSNMTALPISGVHFYCENVVTPAWEVLRSSCGYC